MEQRPGVGRRAGALGAGGSPALQVVPLRRPPASGTSLRAWPQHLWVGPGSDTALTLALTPRVLQRHLNPKDTTPTPHQGEHRLQCICRHNHARAPIHFQLAYHVTPSPRVSVSSFLAHLTQSLASVSASLSPLHSPSASYAATYLKGDPSFSTTASTFALNSSPLQLSAPMPIWLVKITS